MAVTGFWPVCGNLNATLKYADNPDKTTPREYLDEDLFATLRYAKNDDKTDKELFVGGINCSKQNAYAEMIAVQRRFGMKGKVVGYHGIQSFQTGEVTPEQAFEIGKETARRMWGDRYQVLVTVHLNTDNLHCHFVVNPCSFVDGQKFKNKIGDHKELRRISDEICREHGLSVLENSDFYSKGKKKEYWVHRSGQKTHRDCLREDIEYCLSYSSNPEEFEKQLSALGYELDRARFSVKAKNWERSVRLAGIGFTKEIVNVRLEENRSNIYFYCDEWNTHLPYKPKKFPLEDELRRLEFSVEHSYDTATVLVDTMFLILITLFELVYELADVMLLSPDIRAAERDLKTYVSDYHFLKETGIRTIPELQTYISETETKITDMESERQSLRNKIRHEKSHEVKAENREQRAEITNQIEPLRKSLRRAKDVLENSPHIYELLKNEHELERKARSRYMNRSR